MIETLHTRIDERLPASIQRRSGELATQETLCEVTVERFMGVVIHPVPPYEMEKQSGTFRPGGKVLIEWPSDLERWREVEPGDELMLDGRVMPILATWEYPHCFAEIYVDQGAGPSE